LAHHIPTKPIAATASDAKTTSAFGSLPDQHKMINCKVLKNPARSVAYSPDGKVLAIGMKDGVFDFLLLRLRIRNMFVRYLLAIPVILFALYFLFFQVVLLL